MCKSCIVYQVADGVLHRFIFIGGLIIEKESTCLMEYKVCSMASYLGCTILRDTGCTLCLQGQFCVEWWALLFYLTSTSTYQE